MDISKVEILRIHVKKEARQNKILAHLLTVSRLWDASRREPLAEKDRKRRKRRLDDVFDALDSMGLGFIEVEACVEHAGMKGIEEALEGIEGSIEIDKFTEILVQKSSRYVNLSGRK